MRPPRGSAGPRLGAESEAEIKATPKITDCVYMDFRISVVSLILVQCVVFTQRNLDICIHVYMINTGIPLSD